MKAEQAPVLIAGAGVGGLTAAVALKRRGFRVKVFEVRQRQALSDGTALNLWSNATSALGYIGLAHRVAAQGVPIDRAEICSAGGGKLLTSDTKRLVDIVGTPSVSIRRSHLMAALLEAAGEEDVQFGVACTGVAQDENGVRLQLDGGQTVEGSILVAADGVRSRIRNLLLKEDGPHYLGQTVWRGIGPAPAVLAPATLYMMWGPSGVVGGCYAVDAGEACWFVGTKAEQGGRDAPGAARRHLLGLLQRVEGPLRPVVEATGDNTIIRTDLFARPLPETWSYGRVVLLGDAAHAMPTALGQGGCQAIEDGVVLAESVNKHGLVLGLAAYDRQRLPRVRWVRGKVERIWSFQEFTSPMMCWLRNQIVTLIPQRGSQKMWQGLLSFSLSEE
jgi:2-polyprenyl-6-methoxyphenol hydroxylase-like FAD-dependent oxidoreductase